MYNISSTYWIFYFSIEDYICMARFFHQNFHIKLPNKGFLLYEKTILSIFMQHNRDMWYIVWLVNSDCLTNKIVWIFIIGFQGNFQCSRKEFVFWNFQWFWEKVFQMKENMKNWQINCWCWCTWALWCRLKLCE